MWCRIYAHLCDTFANLAYVKSHHLWSYTCQASGSKAGKNGSETSLFLRYFMMTCVMMTCVCVCVCVRERERESGWVSECACEWKLCPSPRSSWMFRCTSEWVRERVSKWVNGWASVWVSERFREWARWTAEGRAKGPSYKVRNWLSTGLQYCRNCIHTVTHAHTRTNTHTHTHTHTRTHHTHTHTHAHERTKARTRIYTRTKIYLRKHMRKHTSQKLQIEGGRVFAGNKTHP